MFQIDDSTAVAVEPTPAAPGTPGYFTDGNPSTGVPATIVTADWFNAVTDELLNILVAAGVTPAKATHNQVVTAIQLLISTKIDAAFLTYAGNPNGHVAGTAGVAGTNFPTMLWDSTDGLLWVCTTSGTTSTAVWTNIGGAGGAMPFWCGTSTGSANAQTLATPVSLLTFTVGTAVSFKAGFTNTGAMTLTVGTFGTFSVEKDSPTGPIALTGGEVVAGNILTARYDGTTMQLTATELGTAALANASSETGMVAAVIGATTAGNLAEFNDATGTIKEGPALSSAQTTVAAVSGAGSITPGHVPTFSDANGTLVDGGPYNVPSGNYINGNATVAPGVYIVDTSAGPVTLTLAAGEPSGASWEFIDGEGTWSQNNLTLNFGAYTFTPPYASQAQAGPLICNVAGEAFTLWFNGSTLRVI